MNKTIRFFLNFSFFCLVKIFYWNKDRLQYYFINCFRKSVFHAYSVKKQPRLAVFAIYQPKGLSIFVKRAITYLSGLKYDIAIVVPHSLTIEDKTFIEKHCRFNILRKNIGRDFGSYKEAIISIGFNEISKYKRVLLINDSIFFPIGNYKNFANELEVDADVIAMCENRERRRHLQSFFMDMNTSLFCHPHMQKFWLGYKPFNSRFHAIMLGEHRLSRVLYKLTQDFHIIYSPENVFEKIIQQYDWNGSLTAKLYFLLSDVIAKHIKDWLAKDALQADPKKLEMILLDKIRKMLEETNITHSFSFFLLTLAEAPFLKRDIYFRLTCDLTQVKLALASIVNESELNSILSDLHIRGSINNLNSLERKLAFIGAK